MKTSLKSPLAPVVAVVALLATALAGCGGGSTGGSNLSGTVKVDGSSTVYPFAQAAAEEFQGKNGGVKVTVGESGTGGGFEKFCAGETDISNASRPIEPEEKAACKKKGIEYRELQVANDGIAIVSNPALKIECLSTDELKRIWNKGSKVQSAADVKSGLPSTTLSLYGPGTDSGTFDYFTGQINGEEGASRTDYQPSEDDNVLVQGVSGDKGGLGYFGFSYFEQNSDKLNLVAVDGGNGCVKPDAKSIQDGSYKPLARPIFMYVSESELAREEVKQFLAFALDSHAEISDVAKIVPMSESQAAKAKETLNAGA
ncbi:MAG: PstS family phosphate ABC transporter substrate-binding protein [Actinobacteria bacterium]|nr:PstS family phosphate ABC transporter substrate-binding protein [Actinomycetota bacterium]